MIINGMLYYKLRRIEILADGIKNDPNVVNKYQKSVKITGKFFCFKCTIFLLWLILRLLNENGQQNKNVKDINELRQVLSYMLKVMEKVNKLSISLNLNRITLNIFYR